MVFFHKGLLLEDSKAHQEKIKCLFGFFFLTSSYFCRRYSLLEKIEKQEQKLESFAVVRYFFSLFADRSDRKGLYLQVCQCRNKKPGTLGAVFLQSLLLTIPYVSLCLLSLCQ